MNICKKKNVLIKNRKKTKLHPKKALFEYSKARYNNEIMTGVQKNLLKPEKKVREKLSILIRARTRDTKREEVHYHTGKNRNTQEPSCFRFLPSERYQSSFNKYIGYDVQNTSFFSG